MGRESNSKDPLAEVRTARAREQAEREERAHVDLAVGLLRNCADYATPGLAIHIEPGESWALREERAGAAVNLDVNQEFCEAWVRTRWLPSIEAVLRVVDAKVIEQMELVLQEGPGAGVTRAAFRTVHRLYCQLLRDRDAVAGVITNLASLRAELGENRYAIQQVFIQLAGHVDRATRKLPSQPVAPRTPSPDAQDEPRYAEDFSWMVVHGTTYRFPKSQQAQVIKLLHTAWVKAGKKDGFGLREATLGEKVGSASGRFRIYKVFERHEALNSILRTPHKGTWALYLNEPI